MFKLCCVLAFVSVALAAPTDEPNVEVTTVVTMPTAVVRDSKPKMEHDIVEIVESGSEHKEDGSYNFHFRGEDGSFREETAIVKNPGTEDQYLEVSGSYSYIDGDGKEVVVHYKADNHGFVPEGNNIHEEISVSAKFNSEHSMKNPVKSDDDVVVVDEH